MVGPIITTILIGVLYGGFGGYTAGLVKFNNESVNSKLAGLGMEKIEYVFVQGGHGFSFLGKTMIGGGGVGGSEKRVNDTMEVTYSIGGGFFQVGYIPVSLGIFNPFLMFGIGGFGEDVRIRVRTQGLSWDSVWTDPKREVTMSRGGFSISPSIGFVVLPQKLPVGLMAMVSYNTILSKNWSLQEGYELLNSPESPLGSFSLSLSVIFGGGYERKGN